MLSWTSAWLAVGKRTSHSQYRAGYFRKCAVARGTEDGGATECDGKGPISAAGQVGLREVSLPGAREQSTTDRRLQPAGSMLQSSGGQPATPPGVGGVGSSWPSAPCLCPASGGGRVCLCLLSPSSSVSAHGAGTRPHLNVITSAGTSKLGHTCERGETELGQEGRQGVSLWSGEGRGSRETERPRPTPGRQ